MDARVALHQLELLSGEEKSVHRLIELLGGQWGRIPLQKQYDDAERALFESVQKSDETSGSFLDRTDVLWSKLLSRKMTEQLQAYIILREPGLSPEEKKKVIPDCDRENSGSLSMQRVTEAIRLLGANFFQEMTGTKKGPKGKVYDLATLLAHDEEEEEEATDATLLAQEEWSEDSFIESLPGQGDDDACLIADFEETAVEMLQEDSNLATAYSACQEARARLSEKFRNHFWPSRSSTSVPKSKKDPPSTRRGVE